MKRITVIAIAVCLLASLAAAGSASAQDHAARANVPFGFNVGNTWLPAGTYTLTSDSLSPNVIAIRSGDRKIALLSVARPSGQRSDTSKLVFKKYGDQYFLHEIACTNCGMNVEFSGSKREREAQTREASLPSATDVYLALK